MRSAWLLLLALLFVPGAPVLADAGADAGLDGGTDADTDVDTDTDADVDAAPDAAADAGPLEPAVEMVCKCGAVGARGRWSLLELLL